MNGPYADLVSVPRGIWSAAAPDYYVCTRCGYGELYVRSAADLPKIAQQWPAVKVSSEPDS